MKTEAIIRPRSLTDDSQAILLLCSTLALPKSPTAPKPLSRSEWNDLARAISASRFARPGALFGAAAEDLCKELGVKPALSDRMIALLERGAQLAIERERLQSLGIWALTRADIQYPAKLKARLKAQAPPVLFGAGPVEALGQPGLAIVGSRDVDDAGATFAKVLGERCALNHLAVFSGGARGVDQIAVKAALDRGGVGVAVLADSLEDALKRRDTRLAILDSRLTIVTALHPSMRFTVAAAMGRNKLIYALASWAAVVSSGLETGGTWAGAIENLRSHWVPLFVRDDDSAPDGNRELIKRGGVALSLRNLDAGLKAWLDEPLPPATVAPEAPSMVRETARPYTDQPVLRSKTEPIEAADLYPTVWPLLAKYLSIPRTEADVAMAFALERAQTKKWLERAVRQGAAEKLKRPVRFRIVAPVDEQKGLFDG